MASVKNWSYSSLSLFEKCPRAYQFSKILKLPRKSSPAAERGINIHAKGENFLLGNIIGVPKEFKPFEAELKNLKKNDAGAETQYCFLKGWKQTNWDNWAKGWLRLVLDSEVWLNDKELLIIDFKTGRKYDSHEDQANLYATAMMQLHPEIEEVHCEFWYLDQEDIADWNFKAGIKDDLREYWENRIAPLFKEKEWPAKPSQQACRWCDFKEHCDAHSSKTA